MVLSFTDNDIIETKKHLDILNRINTDINQTADCIVMNSHDISSLEMPLDLSIEKEQENKAAVNSDDISCFENEMPSNLSIEKEREIKAVENSNDISCIENEKPLDLSIGNERKNEASVHRKITGFNISFPLDLTVKRSEANVVEISEPTDLQQMKKTSLEGICTIFFK